METRRYRIFVGVDLDARLHQASVVDATGEFVAECGFAPGAQARAWLLNWLLDLSGAGPACIAIGVQTPDGALVHLLLKRGMDVYAIDPHQLDRFYALRNAKDNYRGAFVLAEALRTDFHRFQFLTGQPPVTGTPQVDSRLDERGPGAATPGPSDPGHLSTLKGAKR